MRDEMSKADVDSFLTRMRAECEARDAAEAAAAGISVDQLHARREVEFEGLKRAEVEDRNRQAREDAFDRYKHLPITDLDMRAIVYDELGAEFEPMKAVREWLATDVPILVLGGTVGRGKTVAACWAVVKHGGRYMRAREFERLFAHRYGEYEIQEQHKFMRAALAVVDDIGGREDTAEGLGSYLLDLVDERRHARTRTVLITNQPRKRFEEMYPDPRLHSRLSQSATWRVTRGDDLRGKP